MERPPYFARQPQSEAGVHYALVMAHARVATASQARILLRPDLFPLLSALIEGPTSVGDLAPRVHATPRQVYHHLQTLVAAGVAEIAGERPRAGRAVKLYRVPAPWFIPFEITGSAHLTDFLGTQLFPRLERIVALSAAQLLAERPDWGYWLDADHIGLGTPTGLQPFTQDTGSPLALSVGGLHLNAVQARTFHKKLNDLLNEFSRPSQAGPEAHVYSVALFMTRGDGHT